MDATLSYGTFQPSISHFSPYYGLLQLVTIEISMPPFHNSPSPMHCGTVHFHHGLCTMQIGKVPFCYATFNVTA